MNLKNKKLIVFDLDGTLTESKSPLTPDVEALLLKLLAQKPVAIIGGGRWQQFQKQFLEHFNCAPALLRRLFMFPTTASSFYRYQDGWQQVYAHTLPTETKQKIFAAFDKILKQIGYKPPEKVYGKVIEDRGSQISFSAVGQDIVDVLGVRAGVAAKAAWAQLPWRKQITDAMQAELPELEVKMGGISTIDIVQKGINKAYGLRQIERHVQIPIADMLFVGDAIYPGGNDYAIVETGVRYVHVAGPAETKEVIQKILTA